VAVFLGKLTNAGNLTAVRERSGNGPELIIVGKIWPGKIVCYMVLS